MTRVPAAALAFVLLAAGCGLQRSSNRAAPSGNNSYGSGVSIPGRATPALTAPGQAGGQAKPGTAQPTAPGRSSAGGRQVAPGPGSGPNDEGVLGSYSRLYLQSRVPKLVVEIDYVSGYKPLDSTVSMLRRRLESVVDKPSGLEVLVDDEIPASSSQYGRSELTALDRAHRDNRSTSDTATMYILFVNGSGKDQFQGAAGVAYTASNVVIFDEQIQSIPFARSQVEPAATVHEVGHLLGLVNIGYKSPRDHEDASHKGHSSNRGSVMYWATDDLQAVVSTFSGQSIPNDYDSDDRADLADLKSGRL